MNYLYYPGCSLKGTGRAYEESILSVFENLGVGLTELEDWNCCGATAYMAISELKAFGLSARNLALAEKQAAKNGCSDMVVPCAACFLGLNKAQRYLKDYPKINHEINDALKSANLSYSGKIRARHPLDVLVNDIGLEKISQQVKNPLKGLKVASYYGCQIVRPYADFDDQHNPIVMDRLMQALGATIIEWPLKTRCCGGSLTGTVQDVGMRLSYLLLKEAKKRGAEVIVTACPLCQFNLECYQGPMSREYKEDMDLPVAYFAQMMGRAMNIADKKLGMQRLFVPPKAKAAMTEGGAHVSK